MRPKPFCTSANGSAAKRTTERIASVYEASRDCLRRRPLSRSAARRKTNCHQNCHQDRPGEASPRSLLQELPGASERYARNGALAVRFRSACRCAFVRGALGARRESVIGWLGSRKECRALSGARALREKLRGPNTMRLAGVTRGSESF